MGTLAHLYNPTGSKIAEEKYGEVHERMKTLITRMGCMDIQENSLYGKTFYTIDFPEYDEDDKISIGYNYFAESGFPEEEPWGWAGYDGRDHNVISTRVGCPDFTFIVLAAYTLQILYLDGPTLLFDNGFVRDLKFVGLINGLFGENFRSKNEDPWKMIVTLHDDPEYRNLLNRSNLRNLPWKWFGTGIYGVSQITALTEGVEAASRCLDNFFSEVSSSTTDLSSLSPSEEDGENMRRAREKMNEYADESINKEEDAVRIVSLFSQYLDFLRDMKSEVSFDQSLLDNFGDDPELNSIFCSMRRFPVEMVKCVSEAFEVDFWDLYEEIRDTMKNPPYHNILNTYIPSLTIQDFLDLSDEDLIPYFRSCEDVKIQDETLGELQNYKLKLEEIRKDFQIPKKPLKWIVEILDNLDELFPTLAIFNTFFEDSLDNLNNREFMAIWKLLEDEFVDESEEAYHRSSEEHRKFKLLSGALGNRTLREEIFGL